ncbi:barstar family protein [Streptomyces sp. NPDC049813]|uniref:barstar family protein n=1 Tax=Streptomyces sp. NPDC049813 TaxID=3365597 RepID=UPI00378FADCD
MSEPRAPQGQAAAVRFLDLDGVADKAAFMERCATVLGLPDWFGRNWDALADALADPGQWPDSGRGLVLVVTGWQAFETRGPGQWATARDVLTEAVRRRRGSEAPLTVALGLV